MIKNQTEIYKQAIESFDSNKAAYIQNGINTAEQLQSIMIQSYKADIQEKLMIQYITKNYIDEKN
jgi:hypothetical protein